MRLLSRSIIALLLGLPASALAQTPARADLVGVWVKSATYNGPDGTPRTEKNYVVFREDSTWAMVAKLNDKEIYRETGRWMVSNDSLWFGDVAATDTVYYSGSEYTGAEIQLKFRAQKADVNGEKLLWGDYDVIAGQQQLARQGKSSMLSTYTYTRSTDSEP